MLEDSAAMAPTTASRRSSICQPLAHGGVLSGAADMTNSTAALPTQGTCGAALRIQNYNPWAYSDPLSKEAVSNGQKR